LFSAAHLGDVLQQFLLVAPAALIALPWTVARRRAAPRGGGEAGTGGALRFLALAAAGPAAFAFLGNPEVGAFRDWDVFAHAAVPLLALAAVAIQRVGDPSEGAALAAVLVGASLVHTAAWVAVNADAGRAEARFERLLESCRVSGHARAYGWETLATLRRDRGDLPAAAEAFERSAAIAGTNPRLWNAAAELRMQQGEEAGARIAWERALALDPRNADAHFGLGVSAFRAGDLDRAVRHLEAAVTARPGFALAHYDLALAHLRRGDAAAGVAGLEAAIRARPDLALAWETLGSVHRAAGRLREARVCLQRALELEPNGAGAERIRRWLAELPSTP
jgi:tetratricopeptide (TPR) repeat protein